MQAWKAAHPQRPLVLVLTGTDLYRDIRSDADARASLRLADRMVVLQAKGLDELNAAQRAKTRVIFQSVRALRRQAPPRSYFLVTVIGHLREEKDPFRAAQALAHLPRSSDPRRASGPGDDARNGPAGARAHARRAALPLARRARSRRDDALARAQPRDGDFEPDGRRRARGFRSDRHRRAGHRLRHSREISACSANTIPRIYPFANERALAARWRARKATRPGWPRWSPRSKRGVTKSIPQRSAPPLPACSTIYQALDCAKGVPPRVCFNMRGYLPSYSPKLEAISVILKWPLRHVLSARGLVRFAAHPPRRQA